MNSMIEQMLSQYNAETIYDKKNAIKEIMQEIVLCGLSRAGFFKDAAFYGGTALRIFYGLNRFSEDLDFSLMSVDMDFDLAAYFPILEKEIKSFECDNYGKREGNRIKYQISFFKGQYQRTYIIVLFKPAGGRNCR